MTSNNVSLRALIAPHFHPIHKEIREAAFSEFWLKGGRGSTKSAFVALEIVYGIMDDKEANGIVLRKVGDTIRTSVMETLMWAINQLEVGHLWKRTYSPAELTYLPTGQKIIMKGLDDSLKLKSLKTENGYFKFLWFEEATEFNGMDEIRNVEQSVQRGGDVFVEFITYNPPNDPAAWVNKESEVKYDFRRVHHSTYLTVDPIWLGKEFIKKAEALKIKDRLKYDHEYMGLAVGRAEQIVFHGKWKEKEFATPPLSQIYQNRYFFGGDWGFANDPTTLIRCYIMIEGDERNLYIDYETGGVGVEMEEIPALYNVIPDCRRWIIYADCSRPETISYVSRKGYNVQPCAKWEGSVEDGIEYLRTFSNIYIHTRCVKTIAEMTTYSYKVDKNTQKILPIIATGQDDHFIDALRYALSEYITHGVSILDVL